MSVYRHLRRKLSARGKKNRTNCVRKSPNETKDEKYFFGNRKPRRKKKTNSKLVWYFLGVFCVSASNFSGVYLLSEKPDYYVRRALHIIYTCMYCSHRTSNIIAGLAGIRIGTRVFFPLKIGFRLEKTSIYVYNVVLRCLMRGLIFFG